jgi:hypothetical protein
LDTVDGSFPKYSSLLVWLMIPDSDFIWMLFFLAQRPTSAPFSLVRRCHLIWRNAAHCGARKQFLPSFQIDVNSLPFIPQNRGWTHFDWSLTPWSQEVLIVMA